MKNKKYYFLYLASLLIISFVWIGPITQTHEIEVKMFDDEIIRYAITEEKDEPERKFWNYLENTNEIITFVVGSVNIYFIIKHIRKYLRKKRDDDEMSEQPKKFGRLLKNLFMFN